MPDSAQSLDSVETLARPSAVRAVRRESALVFRAYQGLEGLERIASQWSELLESIPDARFHHYPGWYRAFLASRRSDPDGVWFVAGHRGDMLIGIFPLQFQAHPVRFIQPRFLGTVHDDELQLSDFVFARTEDNECLVEELIRWLRAQRTLRWDELRMLKIADDSSFAFAARARLPRTTFAVRYDASVYFETHGTYEQATRAMSGKFRSNLRRRTRLAESSAPLRFQCCQRREEIDRAFEIFLEIEASGWKGRAGTSSAISCRPDALAFYTHMVREFAARDECVVNLLWHGEEAVAGQLGLKIRNTLHVLKVAYRDEHSGFAPGILLQDHVIRHACEDPRIEVLSLVNSPSWARSFRPLNLGVWLYYAPNWTWRGLLAHSSLWIKHAWKARVSGSARPAEEQG